MANSHALHRCVTEFMLDTCRYDTKTSYCALLSCLMRSLAMAADDCEVLSSGSSVEFYIEPMLPHVGDIDLMSCFNNCLAIPAGHTPPPELPALYQRTVTVYEIIDSHQSGFVFLVPTYILTRDESGFYVVVKKNPNGDTLRFLPKPDIQTTAVIVAAKLRSFSHFPRHLKQNVHGPAVQTGVLSSAIQTASGYYRYNESVANTDTQTSKRGWFYDYVISMRCRCWPPQAADWPKRIRNHGVPEQISIDMIVRNGCDLVGAVHPLCRQDEWTNKHQWRLSFSRAEVTLLNSWTPVQQIIYHILRYVLKREVLSKTDENEQDVPKLSNYHIKTLMLWECEQKPQSWWSAESSLIKLCSSLLHKLSDWVEDKHCQHYFVSNCNLLDHFLDVPTISYVLNCLADSSVLLFWFIDNYILQCVQICQHMESKLSANIRPNDILERMIYAAVDRKLNFLPLELSLACNRCEWLILYDFQQFHEWPKLTQMRITELRNFDPRFRQYCVAVTSLHVSCSVSIYSMTENLLDELWILFNPNNTADNDMVSSRFESKGLLCIRKAIKLTTLSTVRNKVLEMLYNEMSKAYLHHSLVYRRESTYCMVHVLLAALYYKSRQYQTAIDHCKQVLLRCYCDHYRSHLIAAEYLPQIDESVDTVVGLILLYQHVRQHAVNSEKKLQLDDRQSFSMRNSRRSSYWISDKRKRGCCQESFSQKPRSFSPKSAAEPNNLHLPAFTAHLLARYLYLKCSAAVNTKVNAVKFYKQHPSHAKQKLLSDVLLFRLINIPLGDCTETAVSEDETRDDGNNVSSSMDTTRLVRTLELVALENLVSSRQVVVRELHCKKLPHVNEFKALYAYKCGSFEECMKICRRDIDVLRSASCVQHHLVAYPEMLCLMDGELVSIFGLIRLLRPNFLFESAYNSKLSDRIHVQTLLVYLIVGCQRYRRSYLIYDTMNLIRNLHNKIYPANHHFFLDRLILRLIYRSLILHMKTP